MCILQNKICLRVEYSSISQLWHTLVAPNCFLQSWTVHVDPSLLCCHQVLGTIPLPPWLLVAVRTLCTPPPEEDWDLHTAIIKNKWRYVQRPAKKIVHEHQTRIVHTPIILAPRLIPEELVGEALLRPAVCLSPAAKNLWPALIISAGVSRLIAWYWVLRACINNTSSYTMTQLSWVHNNKSSILGRNTV